MVTQQNAELAIIDLFITSMLDWLSRLGTFPSWTQRSSAPEPFQCSVSRTGPEEISALTEEALGHNRGLWAKKIEIQSSLRHYLQPFHSATATNFVIINS
jgi:hypothetical protein